jgi:hypothetical protein
MKRKIPKVEKEEANQSDDKSIEVIDCKRIQFHSQNHKQQFSNTIQSDRN